MKYIYSNKQDLSVKQLNILAKKFNVSHYVIKHLFSMNIKTEQEIAKFLNPGLSQFYNPFLLKGMKEAVNKINNAMSLNKKIVIVGDYDTDGICATAILYKYFESINVKTNYFLPNRFLDGYGLTIETAQKIIEKFNPDLIITVDCGISCYKEIDYLLNNGVDVIVTDHHEVPPQVPNCICLDPKDVNQTYPFRELCGAGVALKLVHALGGLKEFLTLTSIASLATVADIVPLVDENRAIVKHGLENDNFPVGIKRLLSTLKITKLTSSDIAYKLAPKLNTAGRMGDASLAFGLFIEKNQNVINQILTELENENNARIEAGGDIYLDALTMLEKINVSNLGAIVLKSETWHAGVLGIVCAKLTEKYNRPVCLLTKVDNEFKGSIRSVANIDIFKELSNCEDLLVKFGGHAGAGGLTILEHNIEKFVERLNSSILSSYPSDIFSLTKSYDIDCNKEEITLDFVKSLDVLEPFGFGNERPVFKLIFNNVKPERIKNYPNFIKMKVFNIELIAFNMSNQVMSLNTNCNKTVLLDVSIDSFKGVEKLKAIVKSISYDKLNTNIKIEENKAYYLEQLKCENFHNSFVTELSSFDSVIKKANTNLGNLFVCNTFETYKLVGEKLNGIIDNYETFNIKISTGANTLIFMPLSFENFNNYNNIFFFDEILTKEYLSNFNANLFLYKIGNQNCLSDLSVDRKEFAKYHIAIVNTINAKPTVFSQLEYFLVLKKLNPQFKDLKFNQFAFVCSVLSELKILEITSTDTSYLIVLNKNINNPLTNSKIYNFVSLINKIK